MEIKTVCLSDIQNWILLSKEYDNYVEEIVSDLTEWYEGNDTSLSFDNYMKAKISKGEAFMAIDNDNCCGIIAISKTNNRITFFAISHKYEFFQTGNLLLHHALSQLNENADIEINVIKSDAEHIQKEYILLNQFDFVFSSDTLENGVPVNCLKKDFNHKE